MWLWPCRTLQLRLPQCEIINVFKITVSVAIGFSIHRETAQGVQSINGCLSLSAFQINKCYFFLNLLKIYSWCCSRRTEFTGQLSQTMTAKKSWGMEPVGSGRRRHPGALKSAALRNYPNHLGRTWEYAHTDSGLI